MVLTSALCGEVVGGTKRSVRVIDLAFSVPGQKEIELALKVLLCHY